MERRYQVVTYSRDIGSDEHMDYPTLKTGGQRGEEIQEKRRIRRRL